MDKEMRKVLVSGMIGNALEWYDFILYLQFAPIIGKLFFPSQDPHASLLSTLGIFAVGFVMRPVGGFIFGYLGDKFGRKISLVFSILMMSIPTAFIGLLPTYEQIGIWAPVLLTLIRLLQGIALGGGFSGCMTFLVEHAPSNQRGVIGSASMFSLGAGVLLGIIVGALFSVFLNEHDFQVWGWRIPFIISIFIGMVAFYIKNNVSESPVYELAKQHGKLSKKPMREVIFSNTKNLVIATALYITVTVPFYTFSAFFNTYMQTHIGYSLNDSMTINGIATVFFIMVMPLAGYLSDKFGRKTVMQLTAFAMILSIYPVMYMLQTGVYLNVLIGQIIFGIILGFYMGPMPALLVEIFPTRLRFSGVSLSYNISAVLFGGTAPYVYIFLIKKTGDHFVPAYYVIFFVLLTIFAFQYYTDRTGKKLEE